MSLDDLNTFNRMVVSTGGLRRYCEKKSLIVDNYLVRSSDVKLISIKLMFFN